MRDYLNQRRIIRVGGRMLELIRVTFRNLRSIYRRLKGLGRRALRSLSIFGSYLWLIIISANQNIRRKFRVNQVEVVSAVSTRLGTLEIIVPFYNSSEITKPLLEEIYAEIGNQDNLFAHVTCTVVDDASKKNESKAIEGICQKLGFKYIRRINNLGFLSNTSLAYEESSADYALLLNSDVRLPGNFLKRLSAHTFSFEPGALTVPSFEDLVGFGADAPSWWELDDVLAAQPPTALEACTAVGYALMLDKNKVPSPLFDKRFGHGYGEDSDLHYRVQKYGHSSQFMLNMCVMHQGGASYGMSEKSIKERNQGREQFFELWGRKYKYEYPYFEKVINKFLRGLPTFTQAKQAIYFLLPSGRAQGVGGINVLTNALQHLGNERIATRVIDLSLHNLETYCLGGSLRPISKSSFLEIYKNLKLSRNDMVVVGGSDGIEFLQGVAKNIFKKTFVANVIQGPDFFIDPSRGLEFVKSIQDASICLVGSTYLDELSKFFGAKQTQSFNPLTHLDQQFDQTKQFRKWDLLVSLRYEHGKALWLSQFVANVSAKNGLKVAAIGGAAHEAKLHRSVKVFGVCPPDEVLKILTNTKVFFDSSLFEGFGLVAREALHHGVKVLALENGGNEDLKRESLIQTKAAWDIVGILEEIQKLVDLEDSQRSKPRQAIQNPSLAENIEQVWKKLN